MADFTWISTDGNLTAAGSWSPSGPPAGADRISFDSSSNVDVLTNLSGITANLDRIWLQDTYEGNLGASNAPVVIKGRRIIHQGQGSFWHKFTEHATLGSQIVIDSSNQQDAYTLADGGVTSFTFNLYCVNGGTRILAAADNITAIFVGSRNSVTLPNVTIEAGSGTVSAFRQSSGVVRTSKDLGLSGYGAAVDGGILIVESACADNWASIEVNGGIVQFNGTGTVSELYVWSGTLDMTGDQRAKTLPLLVLGPNASFLTHDNIVVTSMIDLRGKVPVLP